MKDQYYRQTIPELELSIERGTNRVPEDGRFYVLRNGEVLGAFRSFKKALELYKRVVEESGYRPPPVEKQSLSQQAVARYLDAKDLYWAESHKYRALGGKGGRGGV